MLGFVKKQTKLLNQAPVESSSLPKAAETAAGGKTEREALLERQSQKQKAAIVKLAAGKRTAEEKAAAAIRDADKLKQVQLDAIAAAGKPAPTPERTSWGFFN